jgi:dTDP-4-dehydrorhamnose 3,5-epimerase-like enzyme
MTGKECNMAEQISIPQIGASDIGYLSFFQDIEIGFPIKRIYYTYEAPKGTKRGFHAHKKLQQLVWCPYGDITIILDNGTSRENVRLDSPSSALFIRQGIWREMIWNRKNSVLCVAASDHYDEEDYIRDYDVFIKLVDEGFWNYERNTI